MPSIDPIRVLLVNDDPGTLFALQTVLSDLDAVIETANSGTAALGCLLRNEFAVIILDVKMAGLDGFETARLIRQRPRSRYTPIIFLTSHRATDLDRATGYELGAVDYLFMPVVPEVLKSKIQVFIDLSKRKQHPGDGADRDGATRVLEQQVQQLTSLTQSLRRELAACRQSGSASMPGLASDAPFQHAGDYAALLDADGRWVYASPSYRAAFGLACELGQPYAAIVHADDRERVCAALRALACGGEQRANLQYRVVQAGRDEHVLQSDASVIPGASEQPVQIVLVSQDITERKKMEAYILHQSFHDALTGLPNRLLLEDRMKQATAHLGRQRAPVAVLFIDLDRFKDINDTLGHAAGDRVLQEVAERLEHCVRDGDTVARLSGDEFVVLLAGMHDVEDAALVAEKIVSSVSLPCQVGGRQLHLSPSIGIAVYPDDGQNIDVLLRNADTAMYHAKQEGRGRYSFFMTRMNDAAIERVAVGGALQRALAQGEFILHFQPKVSRQSNVICGFEALIRWPQDGAVWMPPSQFIPIAEDTGRIGAIGKWALLEAARQVQTWRARGAACCPVAVNVSAQQFLRHSVAHDIAAVLEETGLPPQYLEAELTESAVMSNPTEAIAFLQEIRNLGVSISIDDFGTGYSSLAYLKRFPLDKLKIDAAFVRDIATDPDDAAIVIAIITLAHSLNLVVIAEGVETLEQVRFLEEHGCDQMQGYYFGRPVASEAALQLLQTQGEGRDHKH
jgi:diguanylate cyclase (GGDEF)-like protein/PAS domain S-box-containing protein